MPGERTSALEVVQLNDECTAGHSPAELLHQVRRGLRRAPGGEHVIVDQHPGSPLQRVGMNVQLIEAILEPVLCADRLLGQLARLARGHESDPQLARQCTREYEPARLGSDDQVYTERTGVGGQLLNDMVERRRIEQQRSDVPEDDPGLREVGDVADVVPQVQRPDANRGCVRDATALPWSKRAPQARSTGL
jgi:hypothetical protein